VSVREPRLPSVGLVRERIEGIHPSEVRVLFQGLYLLGARTSEPVSEASPGDTTTARGSRGTDAYEVTYCPIPGSKEVYDVVVFRLFTAKHKGNERLVAIPLDERFEPWTKPVYEHWKA